jgi:hypothetical protein
MTVTDAVRFQEPTHETDQRVNLLHSWTIGQILRANPDIRLRKQFLDDPYLDQITLGQLFSCPFALNDFLARCRQLPHCGDTSINRLREAIKAAANGNMFLSQNSRLKS